MREPGALYLSLKAGRPPRPARPVPCGRRRRRRLVATSLRSLILEQSPEASELLVHQLRQAGYAVQWQRVETQEQLLAALTPALDVILAEYRLPGLTALEVLDLLQARGLDVPLIIDSDSIGEARAVEVMQRGAADYVRRDHLARLGPAVAHAIERR